MLLRCKCAGCDNIRLCDTDTAQVRRLWADARGTLYDVYLDPCPDCGGGHTIPRFVDHVNREGWPLSAWEVLDMIADATAMRTLKDTP